ncbi:hypothetical protein BKA70DRAFT_1261174 [Coprinopsis sp. MPI-PUGE-AT-0042]|nr:hypothetical protein BKA70DRAFT_1261174 [Coprinopsis sp. MPI-PUGE-AT-0042]
MSASFAFVPRKVASKKNGAKVTHLPQPRQTAASSPLPAAAASSKGKEKATVITKPHDAENPIHEPPQKKEAGQQLVNEEDAILIWLALSDYALWADGDLRRRMEVDEEGGGGYISLNYLMSHSPSLWPLKRFVGASQTPLVKALRQYAPDVFELQLIVAAPQPWFNRSGVASSSTPTGAGGYEIRRTDLSPSSLTKRDWDERTVYVEHVPPEYKTTPSLVRFLSALLPESHDPHPCRRIQSVTLPAHHQDASARTPSFKGFAFVTFHNLQDVAHVLTSHPWNTPEEFQPSKGSDTPAEKAVKVGFRALKKADWETLREEYLAYRQSLIQTITDFQDNVEQPTAIKAPAAALEYGIREQTRMPDVHQPPATLSEPPEGSSSEITLASPYPYGCLVFVKNIHTETNKTTLKAIFGRVLDSSNPTGPNAGLDYVDFTKGMDSCHLRLSTPEHAERLVSHFNASLTVQQNGLDDQGANVGDNVSASLKPISMEIVIKTREEVYWQKVPEKIRRGAVEKAVRLCRGELDIDKMGNDRTTESTRPQKKRRTR